MTPIPPGGDPNILPFPGHGAQPAPGAAAQAVAALIVVANTVTELVKFAAAIGVTLLAGLGLASLIR